MKVSMRKLSEITGYSPSTISNVLNHKRQVSQEAAEKILAAAKECGYLSESKAKSIRLVCFKNSGLIMDETPFFFAVVEGVQTQCRKQGYDLTISNLRRNDPAFQAQLESLLRDPSSAILLIGTEMTAEDERLFEAAVSPVVVIDSYSERDVLDTVVMNNSQSLFGAVRYLAQRGHKKIGYLKGNIRINNYLQREAGYAKGLAAEGLRRNPAYEFELMTTSEGAYESMYRHLERKPELPTAFVSDNDIMALGAMKALKEFGLRIPEDVSIIGLDDIPYCTLSSPALTTIRAQTQQIGQMAVCRLVSLIEEPNQAPCVIQVCTQLVERGSVKDLRESGE